MNWRNLPHPEYGLYGGSFQNGDNHTLQPIDWMDREFSNHDTLLRLSNSREQRRSADNILLARLKAGSDEPFANPKYGPIYRIGVIILFQIIQWVR